MMYPVSQALQVVPVNPVEQAHVHAVLSLFDVVEDAWLLQFFFFFFYFTFRFPFRCCRIPLLLSLLLLCVLLLMA